MDRELRDLQALGEAKAEVQEMTEQIGELLERKAQASEPVGRWIAKCTISLLDTSVRLGWPHVLVISFAAWRMSVRTGHSPTPGGAGALNPLLGW